MLKWEFEGSLTGLEVAEFGMQGDVFKSITCILQQKRASVQKLLIIFSKSICFIIRKVYLRKGL